MNSLHDEKVLVVLRSLHAEAAGDAERRTRRPAAGEQGLVRMGELYLSVSDEEGRLLYLLGRACRGGRFVEFGASFGISTLYLAAAVRDRGAGELISTEVHPDKCRAARLSLGKAGLAGHARILEGDARETLAGLEGAVDLLFLDGWKSQYLPVLELLEGSLSEGALVIADNIDHAAAADFAAYVRGSPHYVCHDMGKQELCVYTG